MKTRIFFIFALLAAAVSCQKLEMAAPEYVTISACGEGTSKTALSGSSVIWGSGDKIKVYSQGVTNGSVFRLSEGAGTSSGDFIGASPVSAENYFAVYPSTASYNGSTKFTYVMPSVVSYTKGTFAPESSPMLSATKSSLTGSFTMYNLCGVMRLKLKGNMKVSRLELTFSSAVSGEGYVYRGNNTLIMSGSSDADKRVAMTCSTPVQLESSSFTEFYFVLPAGTYDGFSLKAMTQEGNYSTKSLTSSFTITRSQVTNFESTVPNPTVMDRPQLAVWSFNIACQSNDDNSSWSSSNYWSKRKEGVYAFFNTQNPDIIGTQECEYRQRVNILDNTSGYAAYGLGVDYGKESSGGSGSAWDKITGNYKDYNSDSSNAIFYKADKFNVLEKGTFWLSSNPSSVGSDDGHNCAWIKFQWKENGYQFYVFNTHFTAYYTESAYAARKAEARVLYDQIMAIAGNSTLPVIVMGDFNATASELCSEDKGDTRWDNYYWARNQDGKTSKTAYPTSYNNFKTTCSGFSSIYASGTCTSGNSNIDSIVYKNCYEGSGKHGLVSGSFGTDFQAYAGRTYLSDHWPITATLVFDYQQ